MAGVGESGRVARYPTLPPQRAKALAGDPAFRKCAKGWATRIGSWVEESVRFANAQSNDEEAIVRMAPWIGRHRGGDDLMLKLYPLGLPRACGAEFLSHVAKALSIEREDVLPMRDGECLAAPIIQMLPCVDGATVSAAVLEGEGGRENRNPFPIDSTDREVYRFRQSDALVAVVDNKVEGDKRFFA